MVFLKLLMKLLTKMWNELIKKIELQSILVLFLTLLFGFLLLDQSNSFSTPTGVLGTISISVGLLYTVISFFSNQIRESYKDVIAEYKIMALNLKSSNKYIQDQYKRTLSDTDKTFGEYHTVQSQEITTEKD